MAVIASLIGVVELAFAYPVTKLSGSNQTVIVWFMVCFPTLLLLCFFATVWLKPGHLYGPKDYGKDESFLKGIGRLPAVSLTEGALFVRREAAAELTRARYGPRDDREERDVVEERDVDVSKDYPRAR